MNNNEANKSMQNSITTNAKCEQCKTSNPTPTHYTDNVINTDKYKAILEDVKSSWYDIDSKFDSIEIEIISAIDASPCEIFPNLCVAFDAVMNDNDMNKNIKTRCYWSVIYLLLDYHNFNNNYIPLHEIQDTFLQISTILHKGKNIQYNELRDTIKDLLEKNQDTLINNIVTYLCNNS